MPRSIDLNAVVGVTNAVKGSVESSDVYTAMYAGDDSTLLGFRLFIAVLFGRPR